jgi:hypothetical protein
MLLAYLNCILVIEINSLEWSHIDMSLHTLSPGDGN